jgi:hypothetical protein
VPAFEQCLGSSAGLAPATVTRLTGQWQADHRAFGERDLTGSDYVYVRADDIHLRIRLAEAKSCVLVVVGVRADGTKELLPQGPHGSVPRNPSPAVLGSQNGRCPQCAAGVGPGRRHVREDVRREVAQGRPEDRRRR